jgi:hypothetical protein
MFCVVILILAESSLRPPLFGGRRIHDTDAS